MNSNSKDGIKETKLMDKRHKRGRVIAVIVGVIFIIIIVIMEVMNK